MNFNLKRYGLICITVLCTFLANAQVRLPALIRDSMILQRDVKVNIWGWANPGEKVQIKFNKKKYKTTTATNGKWKLQLPAMKAGGPFIMEIEASNQIILREILYGDVWLCSGQSNMVHQVHLHQERYSDDIANANYPQIRQFLISTVTDLLHPRENVPQGNWKWANQKDIMHFSGVAFSFAKTLYEKYKVPIGLINASVGGPPIESWMSDQGIKEFPATLKKVNDNRDTAAINLNNRKAR
ncbi:MAG: sialate O-acetylesterase, partial [Flavisolibacter sp.]